jgi:hypothetical protein
MLLSPTAGAMKEVSGWAVVRALFVDALEPVRSECPLADDGSRSELTRAERS